ncbi:MAG: histidine--tRNA ligase [Candidatus Nanoarchaeia archaeon]|nr:histidine--tRNA ligase [Candidatus Nanoarchaeia archaeon]
MMIQGYIGTRDFLPNDWKIMNYLFDVWKKSSNSMGFEEYEAPIIEDVKLFTAKSGEEIKNQLFWFKDKGDRDVCLRAELTPQLARYIVNYGKAIKKPIKWFSMPRLFRYEKPQKGRLREFFQFNADIIGEESIYSTIEIISLAIKILEGFNLTNKDFKVKINSRKIIDSLIKILGVNDSLAFYLLLDKKSKMEEKDFLKELKILVTDYKRLLQLLSLKGNELFDELKNIGVNIDRIKSVFEIIGYDYLELDLSIIRGLDYYTDIVFEAFDTKNEFRAIFGGGEYNNLIKDLGGDNLPAVGFGMGDTVLLELLKSKKLLPEFVNDSVFLATIGDCYKDALKIKNKLISKGINVDLNVSNKNLSKQFQYAESKGINTVYIIGEQDLKNGIIVKKDLKTGKEEKIKA